MISSATSMVREIDCHDKLCPLLHHVSLQETSEYIGITIQLTAI